jgi:hypothetical protein
MHFESVLINGRDPPGGVQSKANWHYVDGRNSFGCPFIIDLLRTVSLPLSLRQLFSIYYSMRLKSGM